MTEAEMGKLTDLQVRKAAELGTRSAYVAAPWHVLCGSGARQSPAGPLLQWLSQPSLGPCSAHCHEQAGSAHIPWCHLQQNSWNELSAGSLLELELQGIQHVPQMRTWAQKQL
jgi:hypothetical protein